MVYPETSFQQAQPLPAGPESSGTEGMIHAPIDRYDVVQFSHALGDELAAINCYSGGKEIAHLYFLANDPLPANFMSSGERKIAVLYYHYSRYNDILDMLRTGKEIYLVYFGQNNARIESRNVEVPNAL